MSSILILNTALPPACAVFAADGAGDPIARQAPDSRQSAQTILQLSRQTLDEAGARRPGAVAVVSGPGSFTGVRIGIAVAQGLCAAWELPALPISSLALVATAAHRIQPADTWLASIRSRADELYFGCYQSLDGGLALVGGEQAGSLAELRLEDESTLSGRESAARRPGRVAAAGDGWPEAAAIEKQFRLTLSGEPLAVTVAVIDLAQLARTARRRGEFVSADLLRPSYVTAPPKYREPAASG